MVDEELFQAQREVLKHASLDSRHAFMTCRKSYFRRPELVILPSGTYVSGMATCKCGYCIHHVRRYLYKQRKRIARVEQFIQKENLHPTLMTLTLPHKATDKLKLLRLKLHQAVSKLLATSGKSTNKLMKKINQRVDSVGYLLRNDITLTPNGWNCHVHVVSLNKDNYSEEEKNQIADEFARILKDSGFFLSRLDEYKIEKKGGLVHFVDDFANIGYLAKLDKDNPVYLAQTNPEKYKEFAQSFNMEEKIPLVKFKGYLMSKINKSLNLPEEKESEEELERIEIPEFLIHCPKEEIEQWIMGGCS